jgi:hypothetical protein
MPASSDADKVRGTTAWTVWLDSAALKSCDGTGGCWRPLCWVGGGLIADCGVGMPFCDFALLELLPFTDGACLAPGDSGVR